MVALALLSWGCATTPTRNFTGDQLSLHVATHHPSVTDKTGEVLDVNQRSAMSGIPVPLFHFLHGVHYSGHTFQVVGKKDSTYIHVRWKMRRGKCKWLEWETESGSYRVTPEELILEIGEPPDLVDGGATMN